MQFSTFSTVFLLAVSATAQVMTVQTSTDVAGSTTEAQMSIPQGETPITTILTNPLTDPTTVAPTIQTSIPDSLTTVPPVPFPSPIDTVTNTITNITTSAGPTNSTTLSTTPSEPSQQPTAGAVPVLMKGSGQAWIYAVAVSGLSVTFGFAWSML